MKKNKMMRLASGLLVAVLLTTSMISGTYAKYVTEASGSDTARVAKWGVELTATTDLFKTQYAGDDDITVLADNNADVIAPGTEGKAVLFTIDGTPEVDVNLTVSLNGENDNKSLTMATLPAGTYTDYTEVIDADDDGTAKEYDTFTLAEEYKPVKWTLKFEDTVVVNKNGAELKDVNLDVIQAYLSTELSRVYEVETSNDFKNINGKYELSWKWYFEEDTNVTWANNAADTYMGQIAAGDVTAPKGYEGNEAFNLYIEVTQID